MSSLNDNFDDELLSAYVDDELTAAERAQVEERLRTDPRAAALVEELRVLSSAVKSLPRQALPRDLRSAVLASVDRADGGEAGPSTLPMPTSSERWTARRRGLIWSAIAIAATLALVIFQPQEKEEGAVARRSAKNTDKELKRELLELPADAERSVRRNEAPPMLIAPSAAPAGSEMADDVTHDRSGAVGGGGGFGGGLGDRLGGKADEASLDALATTDEPKSLADKSQGLAPTAGPVAPGQSGQASSSFSLGEPKEESDRFYDSKARDEDFVAGEAAGSGAATAARKDVRKSDIGPRIVEITIASPDAVSRFRRLLSENKIAVGRDAAPAAAAAAAGNLAVPEKAAAPVEILVDAAPGQVEQLLVLCRADKAFAKVSPSGEKQLAALSAGAAPAAASGAISTRSLAIDETKTPSSQTLSAESNLASPLESSAGKDKSELAKAAEGSTYAYGAPAAGARASPPIPASTVDGRQKIAGGAGGAARVRVLFRFLPAEVQPAKPPAP